MGSGNYFGEDMILQSAVRLHDVRCINVLTKNDLEDVLELGHFPSRSVMKYAFKRIPFKLYKNYVLLRVLTERQR